jgi:hypothetical protein
MNKSAYIRVIGILIIAFFILKPATPSDLKPKFCTKFVTDLRSLITRLAPTTPI